MQQLFQFLSDMAAHNDRAWFAAHRGEYEAAAQTFERVVGDMIARIGAFEPAVAGMQAKSALFRFYRDTRFSQDKSPYKRHFGAYINPRGKKSMHGGYYLHLQPGVESMVAGGCWWFDAKVLRAVREDIAWRIDAFRRIVEAPDFKRLYPVVGEQALKTLPKGFPKDFPYPQYLRPRNYVVWHNLPDDFFLRADWQTKVAQYFRTMQPFVDFINETVDDYIED